MKRLFLLIVVLAVTAAIFLLLRTKYIQVYQALIASGITFVGVVAYIWKYKDDISESIYQVLISRQAKNIERNAKLISEVYDAMQDILYLSPNISNVFIMKFHNGMSHITVHSNISQTITHELNTKDTISLKDYVQNIPCDSSSIDLLLRTIAKNEEPICSNIDYSVNSLKNSIYKIAKINSAVTLCLYVGSKHVLMLSICFANSLENNSQEEIDKSVLLAHKIKNILKKSKI